MKAIVISISGYNALGLVRSLGEADYEVVFICEGGVKTPCEARSRYVKKVHVISYLDEILEIFHRNYWREPSRVPVLCGSDASIRFLDGHYDELKEKFLIFNAGAQSRVKYFLDKYNTFTLAAQAGIDLIKTWTVRGGDAIPDDVKYPCFIKGANSTMSTKRDMRICKDRQDLEQALRFDVEFLVQEYIEKEYEIDVVGLSVRHGDAVYIPAVVRKLRDSLRWQSSYIELEDVANYPDLNLRALKRFVKSLGYEGIFSVELIYRGGKYYFLEVNLRNDAVGYLYTKGGVNYPKLWALYAAGRMLEQEIDQIQLKVPLRLIQQRDIGNVFVGEVSLLKWLKQCLSANCYFYFNTNDLGPYFASQWKYIKTCIRRLVMMIGNPVVYLRLVGKGG